MSGKNGLGKVIGLAIWVCCGPVSSKILPIALLSSPHGGPDSDGFWMVLKLCPHQDTLAEANNETLKHGLPDWVHCPPEKKSEASLGGRAALPPAYQCCPLPGSNPQQCRMTACPSSRCHLLLPVRTRSSLSCTHGSVTGHWAIWSSYSYCLW